MGLSGARSPPLAMSNAYPTRARVYVPRVNLVLKVLFIPFSVVGGRLIHTEIPSDRGNRCSSVGVEASGTEQPGAAMYLLPACPLASLHCCRICSTVKSFQIQAPPWPMRPQQRYRAENYVAGSLDLLRIIVTTHPVRMRIWRDDQVPITTK